MIGLDIPWEDFAALNLRQVEKPLLWKLWHELNASVGALEPLGAKAEGVRGYLRKCLALVAAELQVRGVRRFPQ